MKGKSSVVYRGEGGSNNPPRFKSFVTRVHSCVLLLHARTMLYYMRNTFPIQVSKPRKGKEVSSAGVVSDSPSFIILGRGNGFRATSHFITNLTQGERYSETHGGCQTIRTYIYVFKGGTYSSPHALR